MNLDTALRMQAESCAALGSPFMGQLLTGLADHWPSGSVIDRFFSGFTGDIGPLGASLPLRLAGGLHALVLTRQSPALAKVYPPAGVTDASLIAAVLSAMDMHAEFLREWCTLPPQTNEVRRSAALIPAAHLLNGRFGLPFICSELGASGGLNLMWDRFAVDAGTRVLGPADPALTLTPVWEGPVPETHPPEIVDRRGVDLNPLNAQDAQDGLRLRAYLWPDQPYRMHLTDAAIASQDATVDAGDAIDWLEKRLATAHPGKLHLIYHTVAWQYFPKDAQARGKALITAAGRAATPDAPIAWLAMEGDGALRGAAVSLRLWPGDEAHTLGRADFHGRWIEWSTRALSRA